MHRYHRVADGACVNPLSIENAGRHVLGPASCLLRGIRSVAMAIDSVVRRAAAEIEHGGEAQDAQWHGRIGAVFTRLGDRSGSARALRMSSSRSPQQCNQAAPELPIAHDEWRRSRPRSSICPARSTARGQTVFRLPSRIGNRAETTSFSMTPKRALRPLPVLADYRFLLIS